MRLLIVGGTDLMAWVVRHVVPADVEVEHATSLDEVTTLLRERPPQAALLHGQPSMRPWNEVRRLCQLHKPPIPTLFHPGSYLEPDEMKDTDFAEAYCPTPLSPSELRLQILRLLDLQAAHSSGESSPPIAEKPAAVAARTG